MVDIFCHSDMLPVIAVFLPFSAAILMFLAPRRIPWLCEIASLLSSAALFPITCLTFRLLTDGRGSALQYSVSSSLKFVLIPEIFGVTFGIMVSLLWVIASIYTVSYMNRVEGRSKEKNTFYGCFSASIGCTLGIAFSGNAITLFTFYEMLTMCTYPLIVHSRSSTAFASGRFYIKTLVCSSMLFFMPSVVIIASVAPGTFGADSFVSDVNPNLSVLIAALMCIGVAKAALVPVHVWLPKAMVAPTPVSALLHAVAVVKSGVFTIIKIAVYSLGVDGMHEFFAGRGAIVEGTMSLLNVGMYLSVFTMIAGSIVAAQQTNLKRLLAYSTISQLSYITLAVSMYTADSVMASMTQMICHAFAKITLFFAVGVIYVCTGKTDIKDIDGLGKAMPITFIAFSIGALSMIGVPPAPTFWGKFYIISAALHQSNFLVVLAVIVSTLLNTLYFAPVVYRAFFARSHNNHTVVGAPSWMIVAMLMTCACTIALFFFPEITLKTFAHSAMYSQQVSNFFKV